MALFWCTLLFGLASIFLGAAVTVIVLSGKAKKRAPKSSLRWSQLVTQSEFHSLNPLSDRLVNGSAHAIHPVTVEEGSVRAKSRAANGSS